MPRKLTVGSCFSGIGGLELGLEWTGGFETKWQIEIDPYASAVLKKHWPDAQRFSDITTVANPPAVDVICGGFPCQDVSLAGARAGLEGKRSTLWSEMFRLILETRPRWVVVENVPGLLSSDAGRFMGNILRDLAGAGFDAEWRTFTAFQFGSFHRRERLFLVAYPQSVGLDERRQVYSQNPAECRLQKPSEWEQFLSIPAGAYRIDERWKARECFVCGNDDGIPCRLDSLRCLGNAVVPQVAQFVGSQILAIDRGEMNFKEAKNILDTNHHDVPQHRDDVNHANALLNGEISAIESEEMAAEIIELDKQRKPLTRSPQRLYELAQMLWDDDGFDEGQISELVAEARGYIAGSRKGSGK